MQLSTLQTDTRWLTRTTSSQYSDTDLNRNLNNAYHFFAMKVLESQDSWDFQGQIATADIAADQQTYTFPSDILKIKRIDLNYTGNSKDWVRGHIFDVSQDSNAIDTSSIANNYDKEQPQVGLFRNSLLLFPIPDTAVTGGIKIWYTEEITELSSSTDEPEIEEAYHRGLVYMAAKDYFDRKGMIDDAQLMERRIDKMLENLQGFYGQRAQDEVLNLNVSSSTDSYYNL